MVRECWCDITWLVSSKKYEFENILSINADVLEILVGKTTRGNKKLELKVSITLFIESEISYFNKLILKSSRRKILLDDSFSNLSNKGEMSKIIYRKFRMFIYAIYNDISLF